MEEYFGKSHLGVTVLEEVVQVDGVSYVVLIYDRMGRPETWLDGVDKRQRCTQEEKPVSHFYNRRVFKQSYKRLLRFMTRVIDNNNYMVGMKDIQSGKAAPVYNKQNLIWMNLTSQIIIWCRLD